MNFHGLPKSWYERMAKLSKHWSDAMNSSHKRQIHIISGGTCYWIAPHLALSAPAYGRTGRSLESLCKDIFGDEMEINLHLTKMAGGSDNLDTNNDVSELADSIIKDRLAKIVFFPVAMVDHLARKKAVHVPAHCPANIKATKYNPNFSERFHSSADYTLHLTPSPKVIGGIREFRKDIFLVGFKETYGKTEDDQYAAGLNLCKKASCNLVLANDTKTKLNMIVVPEEARYHITHDRDKVLKGLVEMVKLRSNLTFTRSTVVNGEHVSWSSELVPASLRSVVNYCISKNAYKSFNGATAGHFAVKLSDNVFLTSRRKTNFNHLNITGLVRVESEGVDKVKAYGSKPSVGGQSQRIVFNEHPDVDCIVHFHCPIKEGSEVKQVSQYEYECGSHECGENTSRGLRKYGNLYAVYLKEHGPNIVFNKDIHPQEVINFIDENFDLHQKTGGLVH